LTGGCPGRPLCVLTVTELETGAALPPRGATPLAVAVFVKAFPSDAFNTCEHLYVSEVAGAIVCCPVGLSVPASQRGSLNVIVSGTSPVFATTIWNWIV
jgi:hypothetical protein